MIPGEARRQAFNDKRFVVMPGFFDEAVVKKVSAWLDELQERLPGEGKERYYADKWVGYPPSDPGHARTNDNYRV